MTRTRPLLAVIALSLLLVGCAPASDDTALFTDAEGAPSAEIPEGYTDVGGVAVMIAPSGGTCNDEYSCVKVLAYAYEDCPGGVYIEGNQYDTETELIYGIANDASGALTAGDEAMLEMPVTEVEADDIEITEITCY